MLRLNALAVGIAFSIWTGIARADVPSDGPPTHLCVSVTDFTGADRELGKFLSETLLTDLSQSDCLALTDCGATRLAEDQLKINTAGLLGPEQVRQLGQALSAERIVVGNFFVKEGQIVVNARLLDASTGRLSPGGAANVSGARQDILALSHKLARQFHKRITGQELALADAVPGQGSPSSPASQQVPEATPLSSLQDDGIVPASAKLHGIVTEKEFGGLVSRLAAVSSSLLPNPLNAMAPGQPITRIRALASLVKMMVSPEDMESYRSLPAEEIGPDAAKLASWAVPFAAAAVEQGLWKSGDALQGAAPATWEFVANLVNQMPIHAQASIVSAPGRAVAASLPASPPVRAAAPVAFATVVSAPVRAASAPKPAASNGAAYTGLIVDARKFDALQRTMSTRVLAEDGRVVYPDPNHLPDIDFVEDYGMATYDADEVGAKRAGSHPLEVQTLHICGAGRDNVIVTNEDADLILAENGRSHFLWKWALSVLVAK